MRSSSAAILLATTWFNPTAAFITSGTTQSAQILSHNRALTTPLSTSPSLLRMSSTAAPAKTDLQSLLDANRSKINALGEAVGKDIPEITRLRFAMAFETQIEAKRALRETMAWRTGAGKSIVESAAKAVKEAVANGGWDNEVVREAAPHASQINDYITSKNILTLSDDKDGDLIYVIRASAIEDRKMMNTVTVEQMLDFFLYVKEVHNLVANERTLRTGRLCSVIFANDISGVRQPPDSKFSKALSESSKQYEKLYPSLAGPTMILNLPRILQAFVGLIKPLFPKTVQERLKFERAPVLKSVTDMTQLSENANTRTEFLTEVRKLLA